MSRNQASQEKSRPVTSPENSKLSPYPLLHEYCQKLRGKELSQNELVELFFLKKIGRGPDSQAVQIPRVESMTRALRHADVENQFLKQMDKSGFVATFDGVKIALINDLVSPEMADSIILGNMEIVLQTAQELKLDILLGKYSGDEDVALLAPGANCELSNAQDAQRAFDQKLQENLRTYYLDQRFDNAHTVLKDHYPSESVGLTARYTTADKVYVYTPRVYKKDGSNLTPDHTYVPNPKQVIGAVIDACYGKGLENSESTTPLGHYLQSTLRQDFDIERKYAHLESIFPQSLEIKKIALLEPDLKSHFDNSSAVDLCLIRFADSRLKHTNTHEGHTKGDHHMIATANMIRRLLYAHGIDNAQIHIYQHSGSFLLTAPVELQQQLSDFLTDPVSLNAKFAMQEDQRAPMDRQNPRLRANPFVVATTQVRHGEQLVPITLSHHNYQDTLWGSVQELQIMQTQNEIIALLNASGIARQVITNLSEIMAPLLDLVGQKSPNGAQLDLTSISSLIFASLFEQYVEVRPAKVDLLKQTLLKQKLVEGDTWEKLTKPPSSA